MLLDIAARGMGIDPVELRRRNLLRRDELPYGNPNGMTYDNISPLETFEQSLEILDYDAFRAEQADARARPAATSVSGSSTYVEPSTPGYGSYATEAATIRIEPSGTVNVYIAGGSSGNSIETTVVQLAADAMGVRIEDVHTIQGDTAVTGFGAGTAGSRSASMTAGAVRDTATILRERICAIAAHRLEAAVDDIELADSRVYVRGTPAIGFSLAELASLAYFEPQRAATRYAGRARGERALHRGRAVDLGERHRTCALARSTSRPVGVTLLRYIVSEDCGPMINPNVVEGQIAGGVAQGIGGALYEHLAYDDDGNPLATTLMDYLVPSAVRDSRRSSTGTSRRRAPAPGGYKGVGRRRRDRRAAGSRQRGRRRARAVRRERDATPALARTNRHTPERRPP